PDPALGPKLLQELLKKENLEHPWFAKNDHVLNLIASQLGDIAAGKPKLVRAYEAAWNSASLPGRRVIVQALMNCGDRETVKVWEAWVNENDRRMLPYLDALGKHLGDPKRKHVRDLPARQPKDLDMLWAHFFITG